MKAVRRCMFVVSAAVAICAHGVAPGEKAPEFKAIDQDGQSWSLEEHLGNTPIVVYFYPAAMTGGCTKQACSYRDHLEKNNNPEIMVVGISGDTPENLKHFQQAERLNFPLLSDRDGKIAESFGVPVKKGDKSIKRTIDGREVELARNHTASRWTFVIDAEGVVIYRDSKVMAARDAETVLMFLKEQQMDVVSE